MLERLDARLRAWCARLALVAVAAMLAISLLTVADVLGRWLFNRPIPGFFELAQIMLGVIIAASFPAALATRNNLTIDFLAGVLGARAERWLGAIGAALILVLVALLAWRLAFYARELAGRNAETLNLGVPLAPFWWVVTAFCVVCVFVQTVVTLVETRRALGGGGARRTAAARLQAERHGPLVLVILVGVSLAGVALIVAAPGSPVVLAGVAFATVLALTLLTVPLAAALGLVGLLAMPAVMGGFNPGFVMFGGNSAGLLTNLDLATIPLFVMMGGFAAAAGLSTEIYRLANTLLGHLRGGLAYATIAGCAGFGAVTGSSVATAATIGKVALPEMARRGYSVKLATGSVAAGGTLGMLIPPSTMIVLYAVLTSSSIGTLYVAALVPGLIASLFYMAAVWTSTRIDPAIAPTGPRADAQAVRAALAGSWAFILLFAIVLGGLSGGVFTATEAAAVGAGIAFGFALARRRKESGAWLPEVLTDTAGNTAQIYLLVIGASMFSTFLGVTQMPETVIAWIKSLDLMPFLVILMFLAIYIVLGCFMDPITMLLVTVPVVVPVVKDLGYDLIWWGIMTTMVCEIAMITPPLGVNVFVIKAVAGDKVPMRTVFAGVGPFVAVDVVRLLLLAALPILTLWLPATMR